MNKDYSHALFIVDRSGSMAPIADDMNGGIHTTLAEQATQPGTLLVDVVTFDDRVEHIVDSTDVQALVAQGRRDYVNPRGATALNDAIGKSVVSLGERFAAMAEDDRPSHVIVVVVTDGAENSSREWTTERIKDLVREQSEKWGWTFLYLAANVDAFATGAAHGFNAASTLSYNTNGVSTRRAYGATSTVISSVRGGGDASYSDTDRFTVLGEQ